MRILFVDGVCPKPYDPGVLDSEPLGGTEGTVIRVAEALAKRGFQVHVRQHNRQTQSVYAAHYTEFGNTDIQPTHVVVLRAPLVLYQARKQYPSAKLYFWAHDIFGGPNWLEGFNAIADTGAVPITVSDWHKAQMYDAARQVGFQRAIPSRRIYNPIADDLKPDSTPVDPNKLVFFSSPHKGLERTLAVFDKFKHFDELKETRLYVANPGYFKDKNLAGIPGVINLGPLPHNSVIQHVRSALCVLHLNDVFPETFGLVHAEANAVGTPFLASRLGAVPETADHPGELIDIQNTKAIVERFLIWKRDGRPKVRGHAGFRLSRIVGEWLELLKS